jgi:hypothetical protein
MGRAHDHRQFSPVAEIPFGICITKVVEKFARNNNLTFRPYYHDLPVWIVHEPRDHKERVRRLQVCAYLVSRDPYLSVVSSVHIVINGKAMAPRQTPTKRFELNEVVSRGKLHEGKLLRRLADAWKATATMKYVRRDLLEVANS